MLRLLLVAFASCLAFAPQRASAATCTATITDMDFADASLLSATPTNAMATVTVNCSGVSILEGLKMCPGIGAGSGGSSGAARLFTGPGTLSYGLYQDASRSTGWGSVGNTTLGTIPAIMVNGTLSGNVSATLTLYGQVFASQTSAPPGSYTSSFAGQTAFTYSTYLLNIGNTNNCAGFVGSATIQPSFTVKASPPSFCKLTANDLAFGSSGVLSAAVNAQTTLTAACTVTTAYAVSLDNGTGTGTTPTTRKMTSPANGSVGYGLYQDSARSAAWGDVSAGLAKTGTGNGTNQNYTVYGRVPAQTTPAPGAYTDRIVATVTY